MQITKSCKGSRCQGEPSSFTYPTCTLADINCLLKVHDFPWATKVSTGVRCAGQESLQEDAQRSPSAVPFVFSHRQRPRAKTRARARSVRTEASIPQCLHLGHVLCVVRGLVARLELRGMRVRGQDVPVALFCFFQRPVHLAPLWFPLPLGPIFGASLLLLVVIPLTGGLEAAEQVSPMQQVSRVPRRR